MSTQPLDPISPAPRPGLLARTRASRWLPLPVVLAGTFMVVLDFFHRQRRAALDPVGAAHVERRPGVSLDDPELAPIRYALGRVLDGHEPFPAIAVDRRGNLVASNGALGPLLEGVAPELLVPPVNTLRLALHPSGVAPRILNFAEYREHLLDILARELARTGDPGLAELYEELVSYPNPEGDDGARTPGASEAARAVMVSLRLAGTPATGGRELSFFSTITTFGTASEVTVAELSVEAFFPADQQTAEALRTAAAA
jgi:hypothetical protein